MVKIVHDIFQVYNREQNAWESDNIELIPSWSENFVQDNTTDSASVKVKYISTNKPNWKSGDWCRIIHLTGNDTGATYIKKTEQITERKSIFDDLKITYDEANRKFIFTVTQNYDYVDNDQNLYISLKVKALFTPYNSATNEEYSFVQNIDTRNGKTFEYTDIPSNYESFVNGSLSYTILTPSKYIYSQPYTKTIDCYVPKNHEQYIIKDITLVYDALNYEWDCQLKLGEPIEITNGICCETRSFTNQIQKKIDGVVYNHEALNHYNILQNILETTPLSEETWANRIKISNIAWLQKQSFNDDTFSEPTLYDVLLNKFDSTLGRTPVLYFDINGETDLPYNNERTEYVLDFLRQDGFDKQTIEYNSLIDGCSQLVINESWQNKGDSVISNFDNLAPLNKITYFADFLWAIPEVDSNERNISNYSTTDNKVWVLKTPYAIKDIISITKMTYTKNITNFVRQTIDFENVFEEKVYNTSELYDKSNVIWFTEGENIIHLNDFYYQENSLSVYKVVYKPIISGRYDEGKDYQVIINQTDGQIAEYRFSKYLEQYKKSLNKADIIVQKTVESWNDIYELGSLVVDGDKQYLITNISIQNRGYDYDVVYQLNENHFRKSDSIVAPQEIRKNIEIGYNGLTDRKSCKIVKLQLSQKSTAEESIDIINNFIDKRLIYSSLISFTTESPQLAKLRFRSTLERADTGVFDEKIIDRLCAFSKCIIDNTFCFNLKYFDNAECGKQKVLHQNVIANNVYWVSSPEQQIPLLYTDGFGEAKYVDISLIHSNSTELADLETSDELTTNNALVETSQVINQTTNYPLTTGIEPNKIKYLATYNMIKYNKDMLDIFNFTLGFKVETDNNIILCKAFFNKNTISNNYSRLAYVSSNLNNVKEEDLISFPSEYKSIFGGTLQDNTINITYNGERFDYKAIKSIVLWNEDKEPVIIINDIDKVDESYLPGTNIKINC